MTTSLIAMDCLTQVILFMISVMAVHGQKGKDGFTDEERPYEFGFNIEGYQHRHEKKDENGIIMGEFGFITADGIYHVTVYATDENGDFKILKMKNIKVGFPPGSAQISTTPKAVSFTAPPIPKPTTQPAGGPGLLINTPKPAPGPAAFSSTPKATSGPAAFSSSTTFSTTPKIQVNDGCGSCKVPVPITMKPLSPVPGQSGSNPPAGETSGTLGPPVGTLGGQVSPPGNVHPPAGGTFGTSKAPSYFTGMSPPPSGAKPQVGGIFSTPRPPAGSFVGSSSPARPEEHVTSGIFSTHRPPAGSFVGSSSPARPEEHVTSGIFSTPRPPAGSFVGSSSPERPEEHVTSGIFSTPRPPAGSFVGPSSPARPEEHVTSGIFSTPRPPAGSTVGPFSPARPEGHVVGSINGTSRPPVGTSGGISPPIGGSQLPIAGTQPPSADNVAGQVSPPGSNIGGKPPDVSVVPLGVERPGLPHGITETDVMKLLYRFNYTAGFHGHNEEGYRNGDKVGGYFVNGRNGISAQVKYVANEFGYQPNITFIPLGLDSPDTPKEDTEKNYGLKGYAFEWFNRR
ncbi:hypothetical protein B7P43_G17542 [Cryptotermes secundus]|uniref:Protein lethal(3)malignant blood neoplasm 1 n=1 Tax=Cryptotermes secundus TaxID=105785 RepID=A0A2J7Q0C0_9NEOP|nr:protein lethal(3)malignant blood neoplasm 1 [Cryptotermes secundus]PNF22016.1 hypothetical protein B7P43_G17542 [Cryptotermes secundus]